MRYMLGLVAAGMLGAGVSGQTGGMGAGTATSAPTASGQMDMMKSMSPETMQRCRMMAHTAIHPADPAAMLAMKAELKLTPEQVQKLQALVEKSQADAKALLDPQQLKTLQTFPAKPETPMAMHQQMMAKMKQLHGESGGPMMNCPMMGMGAATQPTTAPTQGHEGHH